MMNTLHTNCKICGGVSEYLFKKTILLKHEISYFQCQNCGLVQTEKPFWLAETYQSSLYAFDTGLIARPLTFGRVTDRLIMQYFNPASKFIDYGGGHGVFVRLMRDKGFDFYRYDKYAKNIYALCFDITDLPEEEHRFELLTSFEVIEHFEYPLDEMHKMFSLSQNVLFSTILQPPANDLKNWFYLAELHGQHISFYTEKALRIMAERFGCYYYFNNIDLHLFTPKKISNFSLYTSYSDTIPYKLKYSSVKLLDQLYKKLRGRVTASHPQTLTFKDSDWVKEQLMKGYIPK